MKIKTYVRSIYLKPFFKYFDKNNIDYRSSNHFLPIFEVTRTREDLFIPTVKASQWIMDIEDIHQLDCIAYDVSKDNGLAYIAADKAPKILVNKCPVQGVHALLDYLVTTKNDVHAALTKQKDLNYRFLLSKHCFADKSALWRPVEWYLVWHMVNFMRHYFGKDWVPIEIGLCSYETIPMKAREDFENCKVILGTGQTYIVISSEQMLQNCAEGVNTKAEVSLLKMDIEENIKDVICPIISNPNISVELVSDLLGTSPRSLQRELKQAGLAFRKLLSDIRCEAALNYLLETDLAVSEVAEVVGYREMTNLTRAFKKRYGSTPREVMKQRTISVA